MIGEDSFDKMAKSVNSLLLSLWSEQRIVAHWEDEGGRIFFENGEGRFFTEEEPDRYLRESEIPSVTKVKEVHHDYQDFARSLCESFLAGLNDYEGKEAILAKKGLDFCEEFPRKAGDCLAFSATESGNGWLNRVDDPDVGSFLHEVAKGHRIQFDGYEPS